MDVVGMDFDSVRCICGKNAFPLNFDLLMIFIWTGRSF